MSHGCDLLMEVDGRHCSARRPQVEVDNEVQRLRNIRQHRSKEVRLQQRDRAVAKSLLEPSLRCLDGLSRARSGAGEARERSPPALSVIVLSPVHPLGHEGLHDIPSSL